MKKIDLSLILTCFNEAAILEKNVSEIEKILSISKLSYELIFVDDRSKDESRRVISKLVKKKKNRKFVFHKVNKGRGGAVASGIRIAKGKIVGFIDTDLEVSPVYIPHIIQMILEGKADGVTGHRIYREGILSIHRSILSKGYSYLVRALLDIPYVDTETGYKFFRRKKILPILKKTKNKRWFWDTEIMAYSYYEGVKVLETPVLFIRRFDKESSVNVFTDTLDYFVNLIKFRKKIKNKYGKYHNN